MIANGHRLTAVTDAEALRQKYREERDKRLRPDGVDQHVRWRSNGEFEGLELTQR